MTTTLKLRTLLVLPTMALLAAACGARPSPSPPPASTARVPSPTRQSKAPTPTPRLQRTPAATAPASQLGVEAGDLDGVEITLWHTWAWEAGETLEDLVADFSRKNEYGIRARAVSQAGFSDLFRNLDTALLEEELPDLIVGFGNQLVSWDHQAGLVVDLNDYILDPIWGLAPAEREDFFPVLWGQDQLDGKRFGLPAQRTAYFLGYNLTWAAELGFERPPETPDEFAEQACAAALAIRSDEEVGNDGTGGWVVDTSTAAVLSWVQAFGGQVALESGYEFASPQSEAALQFLKDLYDQGCAWLSKERFPDGDFASRRALFTATSTAGLPFQTEALGEAGNEDDWTVIPYPSPEGRPVVTLSGPSFGMVESEPERQLAAWLLLKWLLEPEHQARWVQASGHLPSRAAALEALASYRRRNPQWAAAVALMEFGQPEPVRSSWGQVRWALSDAAQQVFRLDLSSSQIPALLEELDQTAVELEAQSR